MVGNRIGKGLDEIYSETILDHARSPRHKDLIDRPDGAGDAVNPFCGDEAHVQVSSDGEGIVDLGIQTVGCSINRAAGSIIAETLCGASLQDAGALVSDYRRLMAGQELAGDRRKALGELVLMETVRLFPVRIKCALLSLAAVEEALASRR